MTKDEMERAVAVARKIADFAREHGRRRADFVVPQPGSPAISLLDWAERAMREALAA